MKNIDCTVKLHINYLYEREKIALENFNMFFFVLLSYAWHGCVCVYLQSVMLNCTFVCTRAIILNLLVCAHNFLCEYLKTASCIYDYYV